MVSHSKKPPRTPGKWQQQLAERRDNSDLKPGSLTSSGPKRVGIQASWCHGGKQRASNLRSSDGKQGARCNDCCVMSCWRLFCMSVRGKFVVSFSSLHNYNQLSPIIILMSHHSKINLNWIVIKCYFLWPHISVCGNSVFYYTFNFLFLSCFLKDDMRCNTLSRQATAIMLTAREKHHLSQVYLHTTLLHLLHLCWLSVFQVQAWKLDLRW